MFTERQRHSFESKYIPEPNTGCYLWTARCSSYGYGTFRDGRIATRKMWQAHRVAWILYRGEIPTGLSVLHKCDTRQCVNPAHLFLGTRQDNMDDMVKKQRGNSQKKTHCVQGHPYSTENTHSIKTKFSHKRFCLICRRAASRRYQAKLRRQTCRI